MTSSETVALSGPLLVTVTLRRARSAWCETSASPWTETLKVCADSWDMVAFKGGLGGNVVASLLWGLQLD